MLILAGVSINAIVGENGILTRTQYATFLNEMAAVEEAVGMWKAGEAIDNQGETTAIPTNGMCKSTDITNTERLAGEVGYYRIWSMTETAPITNILSSASKFNSAFESELIFYPAGVQDLYYLNNEACGIDSKKTYLIDAATGMVYSMTGINLKGVSCYSSNMAKAVMNGDTTAPNFAAAEVSGSGKDEVLAGNTEPEFLPDGSKNPKYNLYGFQIIADSSNDNIYKLYNNGDLYGKGLKGYLLNSSEEEMNEIDSTVWSKFSVPSEIPGSTTNDVQIIPGNSTMYVIDSEDYLWAWGDNSYNKLGLTQDERIEYTGMVATKLNVDDKKIYKVFPTKYSTYVVTLTNGVYELYACGYNAYGQLGTGVVEVTPDKFKKVNIESPEKIINITNQGGKDCYDLILIEHDNKNKIYFCGSTTTGPSTIANIFFKTNLADTNVTEYMEIFNGTYGNTLSFDIANLYRGGDWNSTHINILTKDGKFYRLTNGGNINEIKIGNQSINVLQMESCGTEDFLMKVKIDGQIELYCNKVGSGSNIFGSVNSDNTWKSLSEFFPTGLNKNNIKDFYVEGENVYYLTTEGKVYVSGANLGAGIGKSSGYIDNIICVNDFSNIPMIDSFLCSKQTGNCSDTIILLKGKDGNFYGTKNSAVLFGEKVLQKNWKKIASNVKIFNAKTTGNSLAYIDNNNDLWVLGDDSSYFGINNSNGDIIRNFIKVKDYIENTEMYNHIDGKVKDYALGSYSLRILTNAEDNNTVYVSGYYQSPTWYKYNYLGVDDTENHFEFIKVMDNVKFFDAKEADNFAITYDNKLYSWGLFDGNSAFHKNIPTQINLKEDIIIQDSMLVSNVSHYQKFIINDSKLYNAGTSISISSTNGLKLNTSGNFTQYPIEFFNNESIIDVVSCNYGSFIVLTKQGNIYGCGRYCDLGINNTNLEITQDITKICPYEKIAKITAGKNWFVAITEDGKVYGTGSNVYGILGRWIGIDRNSPNSRYKTAFEWVECPELEI